MRKGQDSNLRTGFAGYTLSRRASSTTRAPFLFRGAKLALYFRKTIILVGFLMFFCKLRLNNWEILCKFAPFFEI